MSKLFLLSSLLIASIIWIYMYESDSVKQFTLLKGRYIWSFFSSLRRIFTLQSSLLEGASCIIHPSPPPAWPSHQHLTYCPTGCNGRWGESQTPLKVTGPSSAPATSCWTEGKSLSQRIQDERKSTFIPFTSPIYWPYIDDGPKEKWNIAKYFLSASPWFSLLHIHLFIQKKTRAEENYSDVPALGSCVLLLLRTK